MNIPVFITSDNNYSAYVSTTAASILKHTQSFVEFYIMDSGITKENQEKIKELKNIFNNFSIEFIKIDENKYYKNLDCKDASKRIPLATYNSALIPVVKPDLEKVLYLDPDIVVMGDIKEMYDFDIKNYVIGALWEEFGEDNINKERKSNLKLNVNHKYFNAGVFIINIQKWLKNDITDKVFDIWQKNQEILEAANQDVLNIVFDNSNYMPFPNKFNWLNHNYDFWGKPKENIIVRHFNGMVKPWEISPDLEEDELLAFTRDFKKFWEIAKFSPFYNELIKNVKYKDLTKFRVYKLMANRAKKQGVQY